MTRPLSTIVSILSVFIVIILENIVQKTLKIKNNEKTTTQYRHWPKSLKTLISAFGEI